MKERQYEVFVSLLVDVAKENQGDVEPAERSRRAARQKDSGERDTLVRGSTKVARATCSRR